MKIRFVALLAVVFVVFAVLSASLRPVAPKAPAKPIAIAKKFAAKNAELRATLKVKGKADQHVVLKQTTSVDLPPKVAKPYVAPKNTAADHCLLVPHQVLDQPKVAAEKPEHSVLKKTTVAAPQTCSCGVHNAETYPQNSNSTTRFGGNNFSFGGFGGGGRFGF